MPDSKASEAGVFAYLPNNLPRESDIVEQRHNKRHPDENISGNRGGLDQRFTAKKPAHVGISRTEEREDHHTIPVWEATLRNVRKDKLGDLVREGHTPISQERQHPRIMYNANPSL